MAKKKAVDKDVSEKIIGRLREQDLLTHYDLETS